MDMTSAPTSAGTNPSTRKPSPRASVIRLVSRNMSAFMTSTNRPSVARVSGSVNQATNSRHDPRRNEQGRGAHQ